MQYNLIYNIVIYFRKEISYTIHYTTYKPDQEKMAGLDAREYAYSRQALQTYPSPYLTQGLVS